MNIMSILSLLDMKSFSLTQVYQFPNDQEFSYTGAIRDGGILAFSGLLFLSISPLKPQQLPWPVLGTADLLRVVLVLGIAFSSPLDASPYIKNKEI